MSDSLHPVGVIILLSVFSVFQLALNGLLLWAVLLAVLAGLAVVGVAVARIWFVLAVRLHRAEAKVEAAEIIRGVTR